MIRLCRVFFLILLINSEKCQPETTTLSSNWTDIKNSSTVPAGSFVEFNFQTGKIKLKPSSQKSIGSLHSLTFKFSDTQPTQLTVHSTALPETKKEKKKKSFEELRQEMLKEQRSQWESSLRSPNVGVADQTIEELKEKLFEYEESKSFVNIDGFTLLLDLMNEPSKTFSQKVSICELIGISSQNNNYVQKNLFSLNVMTSIGSLLLNVSSAELPDDESNKFLQILISTLSSIIRANSFFSPIFYKDIFSDSLLNKIKTKNIKTKVRLIELIEDSSKEMNKRDELKIKIMNTEFCDFTLQVFLECPKKNSFHKSLLRLISFFDDKEICRFSYLISRFYSSFQKEIQSIRDSLNSQHDDSLMDSLFKLSRGVLSSM